MPGISHCLICKTHLILYWLKYITLISRLICIGHCSEAENTRQDLRCIRNWFSFISTDDKDRKQQGEEASTEEIGVDLLLHYRGLACQ